MEIFRVTFTGHREIYNFAEVDKRLTEHIDTLLCQHEFVEFYVGRNGDFDIMVASAIKLAQRKRGKENSSLILVLPYNVKDMEYYEKYYDEICIPIKAHPKSAITMRNRWMVEISDLLISYVNKNKGGAYTAEQYAKKLGKNILNLAEREEKDDDRI